MSKKKTWGESHNNTVSVPMYDDKAKAVREARRRRMKLGTYMREAIRKFWGMPSQLDEVDNE